MVSYRDSPRERRFRLAAQAVPDTLMFTCGGWAFRVLWGTTTSAPGLDFSK